MSRIGKKPILMPPGVKMTLVDNVVRVDGPKGSLTAAVPPGVEVKQENNLIQVNRLGDDRQKRSFHGLMRTLISNMVTGVSSGFEKSLTIAGVGYRAEIQDGKLKLLVGHSRPAEYVIPDNITIKVDKQVNITVGGIDKQLVGSVAAEIREIKRPEPYKGKGIKYSNENVRRKVGKSVGSK